MKDTLIFTATYNEINNIEKLIKQIKLFSNKSDILIIDDNSPDGTAEKIKVIKKKNNFCKFDNLWVKKKDLKKINHKTKNSFKDIKKFLNVKYKWGGKHFSGVDCSALIQLLLNYNNKFCPRDTKDQIKYFKKKVKLNKVKKNDLFFWKGHVAVATSKKRMIHAYGPYKKVVDMTISKTINRIYKTANLKVVGIRRIF